MENHYKYPPLVESVCEFSFPDDVNWDQTIVGRFYEQLKDFQIKTTNIKTICTGMEEGIENCPAISKQEYTVFSNDEKQFDIGITEKKLIIRSNII